MNPETFKTQPEQETVNSQERHILKGPTKELIITLQISADAVSLEDYVENTNPKKLPKTDFPEQTTKLYLQALQIALRKALENKTNFFWNFNPVDPERKMEKWFQAASALYGLKTRIPKEQVSIELENLELALEKIRALDNVRVVSSLDYLTLSEAHKLQPGQRLVFDQTREGRNLAGIYGEPVIFLSYKEANSDSKTWPLIVVESGEEKKIISSQNLSLQKES